MIYWKIVFCTRNTQFPPDLHADLDGVCWLLSEYPSLTQSIHSPWKLNGVNHTLCLCGPGCVYFAAKSSGHMSAWRVTQRPRQLNKRHGTLGGRGGGGSLHLHFHFWSIILPCVICFYCYSYLFLYAYWHCAFIVAIMIVFNEEARAFRPPHDSG